MLNKLIEIQNYSTFKSLKFNNENKSNWRGEFKKNNIIYAPNGSGKTSMSLIFQSLKEKNASLILKKKRISSIENPKIRLLFSDKGAIHFDNNNWSTEHNNIYVFNSFYFDDNVYTFNLSNNDFIDILYLDEDMKEQEKELDNRIKKRSVIRKRIKNNKGWIRHYKKYMNQKENKKNYNSFMDKNRELKKVLSFLEEEITELKIPIREKYNEISNEYCDKVNNYLSMFNDNIIINQVRPVFNRKENLQSLIFSLTINGINTTIDERNDVSFNFYLSDGDKSAIALASFIARLEMLPNISSKIIIVDDPFTSFDTGRKQRTIDILANLSIKVEQLILLTHDIDFGAQLSERLYPKTNVLNLEMFNLGDDTNLKEIDFSKELLTGLMRNITILHEFIKNGAESQNELINVRRSIRVSLEGIFRIKFFEFNHSNIWLGDFLSFVEKSNSDINYQKFQRLLPHLQVLRNINHYSSPSHHDEGFMTIRNRVNSNELKSYVQDTLNMIAII